MKIPAALEQMVAGLISDETKKREEVEAVLSQIHELTESFYDPQESAPQPLVALNQPVTVDKELESQRKMFEARGFPTEEADRRARGILGIE